MHELSICQALMKQVDDVARKHPGADVCEIVVAIGPLSGVEPALLASAFELVRSGCCAAASLRFDTLPLKIRCNECGTVSECKPNRLLCSACGSFRNEVISGDELRLERVKLSVSEDTTPHRPAYA